MLQEYLEENEEVTFETFAGKIWENIHEIYRHHETDHSAADKEDESVVSSLEMPWLKYIVLIFISELI